MSVNRFDELLWHKGHNVVVATYEKDGFVYNVAVECEDCYVVLLDYDNPELYEEDDSLKD